MFPIFLAEVRKKCEGRKISERRIVREAERRWAKAQLMAASLTPQYITWLFPTRPNPTSPCKDETGNLPVHG
jgi:hypothetical protein